jgi:signal transduction histidine kinase
MDVFVETPPVLDKDDEIRRLNATIAQLEKTNKQMEHDLKDSGIELEATIDEFKRAKDETDEARAQAEKANQVKSAFLASMSHELRTPLNAIINFTKFVANETMGPVNEEQKEALGEVISSGKHLLRLINDVLDMSKIESGSLKLVIEDNVNLKAILDTSISNARSLLDEKPVKVVDHIAQAMPLIRGDRQRILQVLLNIVSNACKFTEAGEITITAVHDEQHVTISVKDSGPGISKEDEAAVFEPFKQTESGLRQGGGTGLGMPISKNLAEAHNGQLWLESQVGQGTTFYLKLPIRSNDLKVSAQTGKTK